MRNIGQYHDSWCPGSLRWQVISSHGIEHVGLISIDMRNYKYLCSIGHGREIIENANIDGLVQDCSISSSNALEILQSCTKPSIWFYDSSKRFSIQRVNFCPRVWLCRDTKLRHDAKGSYNRHDWNTIKSSLQTKMHNENGIKQKPDGHGFIFILLANIIRRFFFNINKG